MPAWTPGYTEFPKWLKAAVLRNQKTCAICGVRPSTQVDHITPVAEGGANTKDNARAVCSHCHDLKSAEERRRGLLRYRARQPKQRRAVERHPGLLS
jgi:5-methylcytosine-specific restriction enzyme A